MNNSVNCPHCGYTNYVGSTRTQSGDISFLDFFYSEE